MSDEIEQPTTSTPARGRRIADLEAALAASMERIDALTGTVAAQTRQLVEIAQRDADRAAHVQDLEARVAEMEARLLRPLLEREALVQKSLIPVMANLRPSQPGARTRVLSGEL